MSRLSFSCAALLAVVASLAYAAPAAEPRFRQRRSAAPDVSDLEDWTSIAEYSLCPAEVQFNRRLRVYEVWCQKEGDEVEARGGKYACTTLRYSLPVPAADSDVDIAGGCVALVSHVSEVDANLEPRD